MLNCRGCNVEEEQEHQSLQSKHVELKLIRLDHSLTQAKPDGVGDDGGLQIFGVLKKFAGIPVVHLSSPHFSSVYCVLDAVSGGLIFVTFREMRRS